MSLAYRRAEDRDRPFILSSWSSSFADAHHAGPIPFPLYASIYRDQVLPWILARPGVDVWVAHDPDADQGSDLYGWIAVERGVFLPVRERVREGGDVRWVERLKPTDQPLLLWIFVKQARRQLGIARGLFKAAEIDPTQPFLFALKGSSWSRLRHLAPHATWSPMTVRFSKEHL